VQRVAAGDLILDKVGLKAPASRPHAPRRGAWRGPAWISSLTAAMIQNELRLFFRDPQAKAELLQRSGGLIAVPLIMLSSSHGSLTLDDLHRVGVFLFVAPMGAMALLMLVMTSNTLARDRNGLSLLFTLPAPRESILMGKNAAMLVVFSPLCAVMIVVIAGVTAQWAMAVPALIITQCLMVLCVAQGNLFSVYHPTPLPEKGRNPYTTGQSSGGCGMMLGYLLLQLLLMVFGAPLVVAFILPVTWVSPKWFAVSLPLSVAYAAVAYVLVTKWSARAMADREPEILRVILKLPA
jgi:hypothetical protein